MPPISLKFQMQTKVRDAALREDASLKHSSIRNWNIRSVGRHGHDEQRRKRRRRRRFCLQKTRESRIQRLPQRQSRRVGRRRRSRLRVDHRKFRNTGFRMQRSEIFSIKKFDLYFDFSTGHKDSVTCTGFSRDGHFLATGDMSGVVRVWNTETGLEVWGFECGDLEVTFMIASTLTYFPIPIVARLAFWCSRIVSGNDVRSDVDVENSSRRCQNLLERKRFFSIVRKTTTRW